MTCTYELTPAPVPVLGAKDNGGQGSVVLSATSASVDAAQDVTTTTGLKEPSTTHGTGLSNTHIAMSPLPFDGFALSGPFYESELQDSLDWLFFEQDPTFNLAPEQNTYGNRKAQDLGRPTAAGDQSTIAPSPLDQLDVPPAHAEETHEDLWPMFWRPEPSELTKIGSFGCSSHPTVNLLFYSLPSVQPGSIEAFKALLGVSELRIWENVDLSSFPDVSQLNICIDRYFKHFAKHFPIIHRPTFVPSTNPLITLAVVAIGALYTSFSGARSFSNSLMELLRRLMIQMSERDPRFARTAYYVTTQLLHSIHGFSCGRKRSYELAERTRSFLINNARCARLLEDDMTSFDSGRDTEHRWIQFIRAETRRRIGWAVYAFDATSAGMRDNRPFISLNEVKLRLPSPSILWDAETASAWSASQPWTDSSSSPTDSFEIMLEKIYKDPDNALNAVTDSYQRVVVLKTLLRTMWSYKEQTTQPAAQLMPSYDTMVEAKAKLVGVIDKFSFSPTLEQRISQDTFALRVQHFCDIQLSHILTADDVWDYLHLIWRPHPKRAEARCYIKKWMLAKPHTCRNFIRANAQLLGATRLWPDNHPQEAYNCFHAGMALWAMSLLGTELPMYAASQGDQMCSLDWFGGLNSVEGNRLQDWVETGAHEYNIRMHGVPRFFHPDGSKQILQETAGVLGAMSVWPVARTFMNAVLRTLEGDE